MFAKQLLGLIKKLSKLVEKEYACLEKMDLKGAAEVVREKEDLMELYESCAIELQKNQQLRNEIKASGLLPQVKEAVFAFEELLQASHRKISRIHRAKQDFVESMHQELYKSQNPVKCYSRKGRLKGLESYQANEAPAVSRGFYGGI